MRNKKYYSSPLVCLDCNHIVPISRKSYSRRPKGHIKTMYCPFCKLVRQFIEKQEWEAYGTLASFEENNNYF